jgi:hypothetical protein
VLGDAFPNAEKNFDQLFDRCLPISRECHAPFESGLGQAALRDMREERDSRLIGRAQGDVI